MRMGVDTPVPVTTFAVRPRAGSPTTSFQYKNVGTNIDCARVGRWATAATSSAQRRELLGVLSTGPVERRCPADATRAAVPLFRRFETSLDPLLRDGQSVQTIASTDPVTGEVVKIDVTMNVVK